MARAPGMHAFEARTEVLALDAGAAWFDDGATRGIVAGLFGRACYLRFGDRLLALCRADVAPGPLHLRIPALPALRIGDPVVYEQGRLEAGPLGITVRRDRRWAPAPVAADQLQGMAHREWDWSGRSHAGLTEILEQAGKMVAGRELVSLARLVGGRGPGLTPAGDDLLAGVLVVDALLHPAQVALRRAAAGTVETTDVAVAFLRWAALGQCIAPFHDVVSAVAEGCPDREAAARAALATTGASSGEALLLGLDLALSAGP